MDQITEKNKIVKMFFKLQLNVKLFHWNTNSYGSHIASDQLYESLDKHIDRFVEVYLAKYGRMQINVKFPVNFEVVSDQQIVPYLKSAVTYLSSNEFWKSFDKDYDLQTILSDIIESLNKAVYLITIENK